MRLNYFQIILLKPYLNFIQRKTCFNDYQLNHLLIMLIDEVLDRYCEPAKAMESPLYRLYKVFEDHKGSLSQSAKTSMTFVKFLKNLDGYENNNTALVFDKEGFEDFVTSINGIQVKSMLTVNDLKTFRRIDKPLFFRLCFLFGKSLKGRGEHCQENHFETQTLRTSKYGGTIPSDFSNYIPVNKENILQDHWGIKSHYTSWCTFNYNGNIISRLYIVYSIIS